LQCDFTSDSSLTFTFMSIAKKALLALTGVAAHSVNTVSVSMTAVQLTADTLIHIYKHHVILFTQHHKIMFQDIQYESML